MYSTDVRVELFREVQAKLEDQHRLGVPFASLPASRRRAVVEKLAGDVVLTRCGVISTRRRRELIDYLVRMACGWGPLDPLLEDQSVSDVIVVGTTLRCERRGRLSTTPWAFASNDHVVLIIERILSTTELSVDYEHPIVDAPLGNGNRLTVVIPPCARVPTMSLRLKGGLR